MPRSIAHQQGRINLCDLKLQIAKQLGPDRTQKYFGSLTRLLAQKLTKTEFNKVCILVLGRENIPLHNKLIRSILKNAYEGKSPPLGENIALTQTGTFTKQSLHGNDRSSRLQTASPASLNQCNGNILPPLPCKQRIQKSPLGLNGKVDVHAQQSCVPPDKIDIEENGTLGPSDLKRPRQHYQSGLAEKPPKFPRKGNSLHHNHVSLYKKVLVETVKAIDMEEKEKLKESNEYEGKTPPLDENIALTQTGAFTKQSLHGNDPSSRLLTASPASLNQCNGNILPPLPCKKRIQKSPLGLNEKVDVHAQQSCVPPDKIDIKENGTLGPCDLKRPRQHYQSGLAEKPPKIPRKGNSLHHNHVSLYKKVLVETVKAIDMEEKEKLKESNDLDSTRSHLQAPLGVSFRPHTVGGRRRSLLSASSSTCVSSNYDSRELLHTEGLRKLMEKAAKAQRIEVTLDCANLLNNALDAYLKRLLKSTVEVARVSSMQEPTTIPICEQPVTERTFNGIWAGNHMPVQHSVESLNVNNGHRNQYMISLQDFRVAMELNPQQLGGDWPLILEKICIRSYQE